MDDGTQELKEYFNRLTPAAQQVMTSPEWYGRVEQIGSKYSLTPEQTKSLGYEITFVIIGMESIETLEENIQKELGISRLLSSQIATEVNNRIISYILDTVEKKSAPKEKLEEQKNNAEEGKKNIVSVPRYIPPQNTSKEPQNKPWLKPLPEKIKAEAPVNLPGMELGAEKPKENPETFSSFKPSTTSSSVPMDTTTPPSRITYKSLASLTPAVDQTAQTAAPMNTQASSPEGVQRPFSVPRFNAISLDEEGNTGVSPKEAVPAAESVPLTATTKSQPLKQVSEQTPPPKYIDPYREPIE